MNNLTIKTMLLAVTTALFFSCKENVETKETENQLIGKWEYVKEGSVIDGVEQLTDYVYEKGCSKNYIEFTPTSLIDVSYENTPSAKCFKRTGSSDYTKEGDVITIKSGGNVIKTNIKQLTATDLKLQDEQGFVFTLKKM